MSYISSGKLSHEVKAVVGMTVSFTLQRVFICEIKLSIILGKGPQRGEPDIYDNSEAWSLWDILKAEVLCP